MRAAAGLGMDGFTVITTLTDAFTPAHFERARAAGIDAVLTMPWMFYAGPTASLAEKIDGLRRYREDFGPEC